MKDLSSKKSNTVFSQPGLRYSQAESLVKTLLLDETFKEVSVPERKRITERILDEVKGRMLEEIVQLETKKVNSDLKVFKLQSNRIQIWNNSGESSSLSWRKY